MGLMDWAKNKLKKPILQQEIASTGDGKDITKNYLSELAQPYDGVLGGRGSGNLELYEKVLSDEEVRRTFTQRQDALVAKDWRVEPAGDTPQDIEAAKFIEKWLNAVGFDRVTKLMHYGVFYGYAVAELIYRMDEDGKYVADIRVRNRRRFRFTPQGELRLLTRDNTTKGEECPVPYFWTFCTGADHDDEPYGIGLAHWLYWFTMFKRNGLKFWLIFLEKFGMPTAVGRYGKSATPEDQDKLLETIYAIQSDSGIILPADMPIELLSAGRSGTADYKALFDSMNEGIQRVVLGQTTSSGVTSGRLGNDDLQDKVLEAIIKADADVICESFNRGPVTWLTEMNFAGAKPPRVYRVFDETEDLTEKANRNKTIFETTGYRPTLAQIQSDFGGEWERKERNDEDTEEVNFAAPYRREDKISRIIDQIEPDEAGFDEWLAKVQDELAQADGYDDFADRLSRIVPRVNYADFSARHEHNDIPAQMADQLGERMQPIIDDWTAKIRALVDKAESLEQLRDELLTLYPEMDLQQYADAMAVALGAAQLSGRYQVWEESKNA